MSKFVQVAATREPCQAGRFKYPGRTRGAGRTPDPMEPARVWIDYFEENASWDAAIPWSDQPSLTSAERRAVVASIQTFQLGESGEGKHIRRCAARWVDRGGDQDYPQALQLFLNEEHRHAAWLGKFLQQEGAPWLTYQWSDSGFRKLRHLAGLRMSIMVLVTAEILAQVYYLALKRATQSESLQRLSHYILRDEHAHVLFQQGQLAKLSLGWGSLRLFAARQIEWHLFQFARRVVWYDHRSVFEAAGMGWEEYRQRTDRRWRAAKSIEFRSPSNIPSGNPPVDSGRPTYGCWGQFS